MKTLFFENEAINAQRNLLGIQPEMSAKDYSSVDSFINKMSTYLDSALDRGWLSSKTVVVFPEYIGMWLMAVGESPKVIEAKTINGAMARLIIERPLLFLRELVYARGKQRLKIALLKSRAETLVRDYHRAFSTIAKKYSVTLVGGSIILPGPKIRRGKLEVNLDSPLYNVSVVYRPDGSPEPRIVKKTFLAREEVGLIASGRARDLPVFETPAGRLAVLICADSWYPKSYQAVDQKGAELIAVPAYVPGKGVFSAPWLGYGVGSPAGVDLRHVGKISERDAWIRYAMPTRIKQTQIKKGLTVFMRGTLWDMESTGEPLIVENHEQLTLDHVEGRDQAAAVVNLWVS